MDRAQILSTMAELKLFGMKAAYDEIVAAMLTAEIAEERDCPSSVRGRARTARSIRYQTGVAELPFAEDIDDFTFDGTPIDDNLVRDLAGGGFVTQRRNVVLIGGTGTGQDPPGHRHRHRHRPVLHQASISGKPVAREPTTSTPEPGYGNGQRWFRGRRATRSCSRLPECE